MYHYFIQICIFAPHSTFDLLPTPCNDTNGDHNYACMERQYISIITAQDLEQ